jgi:hypothetical protein
VIFHWHWLAVALPKITLVKFFHHFIHAIAGRLMSTDMNDLTVQAVTGRHEVPTI